MKQHILHLFTRTPLHLGAGSSVGAIDQPIQRERHTRYPLIPGSSIKGVLRSHFTRNEALSPASIDELFGKGNENNDKDFRAGFLSFGEGQLVLFPVRSARGSFAFATSCLALRRLKRDADLKLDIPEEPIENRCLAGEKLVIEHPSGNGVVLEEYRLAHDGVFPSGWENYFTSVLDDVVLRAAKGRFVLLSDGDFSQYAANACQVNQHVRIDPTTGTADDGGLFNEETVPSEALFVAALTELRKPNLGNPVFDKLHTEENLIQFGGNGTTGLGFCTVKLSKTSN